jgi:hypothetical protein
MPRDGAQTLSDYPPGTLIKVACRKCPRKGQYRRETLGTLHNSPDIKLPLLLATLAGDCPKMIASRYEDRCGVHLVNPPSRA